MGNHAIRIDSLKWGLAVAGLPRSTKGVGTKEQGHACEPGAGKN